MCSAESCTHKPEGNGCECESCWQALTRLFNKALSRVVYPSEQYPRVLRELEEVLTKPLSILCQQSWLTGEVPVDCLSNVMSSYKKSQKEDPGNYRPVSPTLVPGKVM
ncbi:hypothetical protein QYF61_012475 [Mycteria americana]|uniref:Uncharacterized protein n=1 Tax=Mycteria americana TaxID=33587 RepID=A0AAN7RTU4_MYCAM|nr:hypothetical protein QYF61_012475 [Mycteria americana]